MRVEDIVLVGMTPLEEAFARLRAAPLEAAGGEEIFIYRDAKMRLGEFWPDELNPTSLYVLKENLEIQRLLRAHLLYTYGVDTFKLSEVLHLETPEGIIGMAPPVVEIYEETVHIIPGPNDRLPPIPRILKIPILKDGIHRAYLARKERVPMRCIIISGADSAFLPYAYPNHWTEVWLFDQKPPLKKHFRRPEPYSFMRPLKVLRQVGDTPPPPQWNR